ncbi:MAG: MmcQ/YjbR family DNA-binding protein [Agarilytica sp.]
MEEKFKAYLLGKPEAREDYPFGPDIAVIKVGDKMFATYSRNSDGYIHMNLKCDPNEALALRDVFESVIPGYHMNKKHWNTVILNDSIPDGEVERMIDRSFGLVVKGLNKAERRSLEIKYGEDEVYK